MFKQKTLTITAAFLLFGSISAPIAQAAEVSTSIESPTKAPSTEEINFTEIETALSAIENIPNEVLSQGNEAIVQWFETETGLNVSIENDILKFNSISATQMRGFNTSGCIAAIGIALVTNGIPLTKITKVKSALNALGGTANAVKKIKKYYDKYRFNGFSRNDSLKKALNSASSGLAKDLQSSLLDFFNLTNVIANCS
ncbi:hypothetical protein [Bacillus sp. K2I17]|uniref:hypothetical protein n=1 Tax=Bacillus sp. K2I17 TaxID=2014743 RepID=UPI000B51B04D|nr:hypothetical protein [Bacillus sp. K2I17]OWT50274.1 hypothetical protein CER22_15715 [Bacillus sp. K2I17]